MGNTVSSPKSITRRELLTMTQKPRDFVNHLFQIMVTQLTPRELLDLGNRSKCKDYVFVMADAIYKTFEAIKIQPIKDSKTDVLYYKKLTDVTKGIGGQQTYEHCLSLAYFNVRIFQIFGALAITVSDDPSSGQVLGYLQQQRQMGPMIKQPFVRAAVPVPLPFQLRGGSIDRGDRDLYSRLERVKLNYIASILTLENKETDKYTLGFDTNSRFKLLISRDSESITIIYNNNSNNIVANLRISRPDRSRNFLLPTNQMSFKIRGFELRDDSLRRSLKKIVKDYELVVEKIDDDFLAKRPEVKTDVERRLTEKLEELFEKASIDLDKKNANVGRDRQNAPSRPGQYDSGTEDGLYTGFIQKYLEHKEKNILPFCVARAIQLVDINVLDTISPTAIKTHICETNFEAVSGMVPRAGESLDSSTGLKSVNQLFYSTYYVNKSGESDFKFQLKPDDDYLQFLTNLQSVFAAENKSVAKLGDLKMKDAGCDSATKGKELQISDPAVIKNVFQTVNALFNLQAEHSKRVIDFMKNKLVEIKTGGAVSTIKIHSNLTRGGVREINKLAFEARNMLTDYYSKCEKIYQVGAAVAKRMARV
jgi:hypothetical protein